MRLDAYLNLLVCHCHSTESDLYQQVAKGCFSWEGVKSLLNTPY